MLDLVRLDRFRLEGFLGRGSDYEAHAATDMETGKAVVVKRPNPDYVIRKLHHGVDQLSEQLIEVHRSVGESVPYLAHLVGYTEVGRHDGYFGDSLNEEYRVLVEERARGFPLVAEIRDKFKGIPIGLGHNLFALHPLVPHPHGGPHAIQEQVLDVEEAFQRAGHLLLDMRPENVFYDPAEGRITVIDIGSIPTQGPAAQGTATIGREPRDIHDFFAEAFKFFSIPETPPLDVVGYRDPPDTRAIPYFARQLEWLIRRFSEVADPELKDAALDILQRIERRGYGSFGDFRRDYLRYLTLVDERNNALPDLPDMTRVWRQALDLLSDEYWSSFLFDPGSDLAHFRDNLS